MNEPVQPSQPDVQSQPPQLPMLICSRCGTTNPSYATQCWLCSTDRMQSTVGAPQLIPVDQYIADPAIARSQKRTQTICATLLAVCVVLTILIGIGIASDEPGGLIAYGIIIGPAYLATGVRALRGVATNETQDASKLLLTFVLSGTFTVMAIFFLAIASFIAFFVWCLTQL